jgi:hypothetical protein
VQLLFPLGKMDWWVDDIRRLCIARWTGDLSGEEAVSGRGTFWARYPATANYNEVVDLREFTGFVPHHLFPEIVALWRAHGGDPRLETRVATLSQDAMRAMEVKVFKHHSSGARQFRNFADPSEALGWAHAGDSSEAIAPGLLAALPAWFDLGRPATGRPQP